MSKPLNVLVVEDSPEDTQLIALELARGGFEPNCRRVDTAESMSAALDEQEWDVVLCDYAMPSFTIRGALALLAQRELDIPFLVVSGNIIDEDAVAAMKSGAHDFVMKDRLARLAPAIDRELKECRLRSERRLLEEKLRQTQKLESLGLLAGGVAHDFNNLLTGILSNASLALDSMPPGYPDRETLAEVVLAAQRAAELTRQLLAYSGHGRFVLQQVDLSALVREIGRLIRVSLPKKVQLAFDLADDLPTIEADAGRLQQLVMNLIINAAEAIGDEAGIVAVATGVQNLDESTLMQADLSDGVSPGAFVRLEVRDSGCGIRPEVRPKIFDPFFTTKFTGRGLGLSAALGIVRGHKGLITVESAVGRGSVFHVFFPASEKRELRAAPTASASAPGGGPRTILVVDDEHVVRRTVETTLSRHGYTAMVAENGTEGVAIFRRMAGQISLVILDLTMPDMDGEQALEQLREIRADVRVLLSSGYDQAEADRRFQGRGLYGFLQKPYSARQLLDQVAAMLGQSAAGAA